MGVPPHLPDRQVLPGGWVGGPGHHVHPRVASHPVPPYNLHPGVGPQVPASSSVAVQQTSQLLLPFSRIFWYSTIICPFRNLAAEVEPSCLLPAPPSTPLSTKPPTRPQFPLPRAGSGAGCLRPFWPDRWLLFPGRRPAVMNGDALSGASLQPSASASTREDYINTPRETAACA